jgi:hypothetical protein
MNIYSYLSDSVLFMGHGSEGRDAPPARLDAAMGLVTTKRIGRTMVYSLYDHHVAKLLDEAVYHAEHLRMGSPDDLGVPQ